MESSSKKQQVIRNIPIFIEGRDEPVSNNPVANAPKNANNSTSSEISASELEKVRLPEEKESKAEYESQTKSDIKPADLRLISSIEKIQNIQQSVMSLMSQVENFDGKNQKDYSYLDEMLTQNLIKLDNIDVNGQENIKNARKEAIKCINSLISLLDTKRENVNN